MHKKIQKIETDPVQALGRKFQNEASEPKSVSREANSECIEVEEEEFVEQQAMLVERLERSMIAVTCELPTEHTSKVSGNAVSKIKAEIKVVESNNEETLCERSCKTRLRTGHKAEDRCAGMMCCASNGTIG